MLRLNGRNVAEFVPEIADNLITDDSTKALSAKQGKVLNDSIQANALKQSSYITVNTDANGTAVLNDFVVGQHVIVSIETAGKICFPFVGSGSPNKYYVKVCNLDLSPYANSTVNVYAKYF